MSAAVLQNSWVYLSGASGASGTRDQALVGFQQLSQYWSRRLNLQDSQQCHNQGQLELVSSGVRRKAQEVSYGALFFAMIGRVLGALCITQHRAWEGHVAPPGCTHW